MEENYQEKEENSEKGTVDEGALDSSEEAFMQGYNEEGEVAECPECSSAINPEKAVTKVIDEENQRPLPGCR